MYGKGRDPTERKYYHFKLSCNPSDNPAPQQSHALAEKLAQELFADYECVIATHDDTGTIHSHIVVNAVSFEAGRKLHMNNAAYRHSKDLANELGAEMGLSTMDWRTKTKEKRARSKSGEAIIADSKYLSSAELNMAKNGNLSTVSWKEALRHAIDEAKAHTADRTEFERYLQDNFGVTMPRNTSKTVSFIHPAVGEKYTVRGNKLGADYTATRIDEALQQNHCQNHFQNQNQIHNDRSVLDARLFSTEEYPITEQAVTTTATATTSWSDPNTAAHAISPPTPPRPHNPISPSQRQRQEGHGKRIVARSVSDISAELRSIDYEVGRIAGTVQEPISEEYSQVERRHISSPRNSERPCEGITADNDPKQRELSRNVERPREHDNEQPQQSQPVSERTPEPKPVVQQKPRRSSSGPSL